MFRIKICGITQPEDACTAAIAGADAIGLNFYEGSSRFVLPERAVAISQSLVEVQPQLDGRMPRVIGVFVNAEDDFIQRCAQQVGLDGIQLHGDEPVGCCQRLSRRLGIPVFRAFALGKVDVAEILEFCERLAENERSCVLVDSSVHGQFGGTGVTADWALAAQLGRKLSSIEMPMVLAGGLTPANVQEALRRTRASGVDVASGVESAPGVKDPQLTREFVENAEKGLEK